MVYPTQRLGHMGSWYVHWDPPDINRQRELGTSRFRRNPSWSSRIRTNFERGTPTERAYAGFAITASTAGLAWIASELIRCIAR